MRPLTTFCLIHGQWHDGSCWRPLVEALRERGHDAITPTLPFDDATADYDARVLPVLDALADVADPVVIVGHSNSSPEAALASSRRRPNVLVHLCPRFGSFPAGDDAPDVFRPNFPFPARDDEGRSVWDPEAAVAVMYPRLARETAIALAARLRPGAQPAGAFPLDAHPDVPSAVIYTSDDEFFRPEWEQYVARTLLGVEPIELPGGHFPMVENPQLLANVLVALSS